jgi:hypothetical protein
MSSVSGSITLPSTLTSMANASADSGGSFYDCSGVTSIANAPGPLGAGLYVVQLGGVKVVINTPTFDETSVIQGSCAFGTNLDLSTIPNLTSINNLALTGAGFEGTLTLPNTLVDVGDYAFSMCKRFNHIVGNYNADPS